MSYQIDFGKDKVIFATAEDHAVPSTVVLPPPEPATGLILPSGEINWNCPCLGGMATGPCGVEFRDAFTCFHYRLVIEIIRIRIYILFVFAHSEEQPKGQECYETFKTMQDCFSKYPTVYNKSGGGDDDGDDLDAVLGASSSSESNSNVESADQLDIAAIPSTSTTSDVAKSTAVH